MIFKFLKKYVLLIIATLFFIGAGVSYMLDGFSHNANRVDRYALSIQQNLTESIEQAAQELSDVTRRFQKSSKVTFNNLKLKTEYPYFLYIDGKLTYWSDNKYVPQYAWLEGIKANGLLAKDNHISVVRKQTFYHQRQKMELVSLIPIYQKYPTENDYLQTGFNEIIFSSEPNGIKNKPNADKYLNIHDPEGRFLFSIDPPDANSIRTPGIARQTLYLLGLGLLFLGLFIYISAFKNRIQSRFELWIIAMFVLFVIVRYFMVANALPFALFDFDLFNPKFYSVNKWIPSLGDLIISELGVFLIILYISFYFHKLSIFIKINNSSKLVKNYVSILLVILSMVITYASIRAMSSIYIDSSYQLDYAYGTSFDNLKMGTLAFFMLHASIFFVAQHILVSVFIRINDQTKEAFLLWVYGLLFSIFLVTILDIFSWTYLLVGGYFITAYYFRLPKFFYKFKYNTTIYYIAGSFVFTLLSIAVLQKEHIQKNILEKQVYAAKYLAENDDLGEGLLTKIISGIKSDTLISAAIKRTNLPGEAVEGIIKNEHLDLYFDKYKTQIYVYDENEMPLNFVDNTIALDSLESAYKLNKYKTINPNIFFVNDAGNSFLKQYLVFIPLHNKSGTVVLDMKLKEEYAESVYPELLMEKKFVQKPESKNYSYAIFNDKNQLLFTYGKYNYHKKTVNELMTNPDLFEKGVYLNNYDHVGVKGENNRTILVSSPYSPFKTLISNTSFLFFILVMLLALIILFYALNFGKGGLKMNFSTKIQVYFNAAFLLPFLVVLFVIIGIIRTTLLNVQEGFYLDNTKNISSAITLHLQNYQAGLISQAFFEEKLDKLAHDTKTDINFFNTKGELAYTSRPLIYDYHLLSKKINPVAYSTIIEQESNEQLLSESLGGLNYKAAYLSIKNPKNERLGIINIPFFDSTASLESRLRDVFATVLSISIAIFLILLVLSFFVSNQLTSPLKMVAQKIKKTNLNQLNEPIVWTSDDEIGVLTTSYNDMLQKLEESKDALSQTEKQSAWREMAKQVAHEIKNPLTPMKLSVQQLQRTLPSDEKTRGRIERALNSLTEQIDNISEIANSFSEFAKMPVPRSEVFDLVATVQSTAYLYTNNKNLDLTLDVPDVSILVKSDHQLINRVLTNLIINGIQAVPSDRKPLIAIKVYRNDKEKFAIIEVTDNGSGIPEDVGKKVFIPNFSTKIGGSGLGLAMAKRGIEHSGGNIWFETELGRGTTFFVDLPLAQK